MTNVGRMLDPATAGYPTLPASSLRPHQITTGMTNVTIAASSQIVLGPNDFALYFSLQDPSAVLSGVARIDVTPLPPIALNTNRTMEPIVLAPPTHDPAGRPLPPPMP